MQNPLPSLVRPAMQEDRIITEHMQVGMTKWSTIADKIPGRIGKQCRERWQNHLDPALSKGDWTSEVTDVQTRENT
jgi:hypothetical protein